MEPWSSGNTRQPESCYRKTSLTKALEMQIIFVLCVCERELTKDFESEGEGQRYEKEKKLWRESKKLSEK